MFLSPEQYVARFGRPVPMIVRTADHVSPTMAVLERFPLHQQPGAGWATIRWDEHDLRGVSTPVREGNGDLGFAHYAVSHNLTSGAPIHAAFQTHRPDKQFGAQLQYVSLATDNSGSVHVTVRVIVQAAIRTDDGKYRTADGKNIGVITAYCEGVNVCPGWVNTVS